jgi:protein Mpv17
MKWPRLFAGLLLIGSSGALSPHPKRPRSSRRLQRFVTTTQPPSIAQERRSSAHSKIGLIGLPPLALPVAPAVAITTAAAAATCTVALVATVHVPSQSPHALLLGLCSAYSHAALAHPIITKAATSGVAYFLGDLLAQLVERKKNGAAAPAAAAATTTASTTAKQRSSPFSFDAARVARSTIAGFCSHGPQLHFWCLFLDRFVNPFGGHPVLSLPLKILLDQTVFALYINGAYCAVVETLKRSSPRQTWRRVKAAALPSLYSSWRFWPFVHALTYSVVPLHLRVLWVDVVEVLWVSILATCTANAARADEATAAAAAEGKVTEVLVLAGEGLSST